MTDMTDVSTMLSSLATLKQQRMAADKAAKALKKSEDETAAALMVALIDHGLLSASNGTFEASIKRESQPKVYDWTMVYNYVKANEAWELLHKRIGSTACKERWDNGEVIPGVEINSYNVLKY